MTKSKNKKDISYIGKSNFKSNVVRHINNKKDEKKPLTLEFKKNDANVKKNKFLNISDLNESNDETDYEADTENDHNIYKLSDKKYNKVLSKNKSQLSDNKQSNKNQLFDEKFNDNNQFMDNTLKNTLMDNKKLNKNKPNNINQIDNKFNEKIGKNKAIELLPKDSDNIIYNEEHLIKKDKFINNKSYNKKQLPDNKVVDKIQIEDTKAKIIDDPRVIDELKKNKNFMELHLTKTQCFICNECKNCEVIFIVGPQGPPGPPGPTIIQEKIVYKEIIVNDKSNDASVNNINIDSNINKLDNNDMEKVDNIVSISQLDTYENKSFDMHSKQEDNKN